MKAETKIRKGASVLADQAFPPTLPSAVPRESNSAIHQGKIRISEIYASVQGEGLLTGTPSIFVRTSGCNLRCWFCDTPFASWKPEGEFFSIEDIAERCLPLAPKHVVLTGGEPMIYRSSPELCRMLRRDGKHLTIETAGTVFHEVECDLISISPKLSGSAPLDTDSTWHRAHQSRRERLEVVRRWMQRHEYQLKFVVDNVSDAEEVLRYLDQLGAFSGERVLLMPQGICQDSLARQAEWLLPWCESHQLRFCPRAHIQWYGNRRGT